VLKRLFLFCIITALFLGGCQKSVNKRFPETSLQLYDSRQGISRDNNFQPSIAGSGGINSRLELLGYLQNRNIPTLESVDLWTQGEWEGLKLTTVHYEIFTTLLQPEMLTEIPRFVESAYYGYNSQLPVPIETVTKFRIYLFADRAQWEDFTRDFAGEQAETYCKIKAGAYCHNGICVAYDIGKKRTFSALGHEGWHQFSSRHFKFRLPSWLDEGVAMLFEEHSSQNSVYYFEPAKNSYRLDALSDTFSNNRTIPLKELVVMNPGDVLATDQTRDVMAFYSQSYALVRFLREYGHGQRLLVYHELLADGLYGNWPLDETSMKIAADRNIPRSVLWNHIVGLSLFQEYVGFDIEQIEQEYLTFCRQIVPMNQHVD
jgi:hypothetical protein